MGTGVKEGGRAASPNTVVSIETDGATKGKQVSRWDAQRSWEGQGPRESDLRCDWHRPGRKWR